jgi:fatty-acyl-CoA synthase
MGDLHRPVTYTEMVIGALRRYPQRVAFSQDGREVTYSEAADFMGRIGRVLSDRGLGLRKGVAFLSGNRWDTWLTGVAAQAIGARFSALHPLGSLDDHLYICDEAEIHTLVFDPDAYEERASQIAEQASLKQVLSLGPSVVGEDLLKLAEGVPATEPSSVTSIDDLLYVLYTGGTTGRPKGARLAHRNFASLMYTVLSDFDFPRENRYLAASPVTHAAGMMVLPVLLRGGTVFLHRSFDPDAYLKTIERERITMCFGVPTMIYVLLDHPALERTDLSSLEWFGYAASPMSPARLREGLERIGPIFMQYYGQTESTGHGTVLTRAQHDATNGDVLASCGKPVFSVSLQLQDDDGNEVQTGDVGEICLRGPCVMDGYWKQDELTEETLRGGWLHSGDMATQDAEGYVTIVDRKKDMIISGGFNVFPREIEDVLTAHPAIAMAAVIGVPDEKWGEAVKAVVTLKAGASVDADELIALVREHKGPVYAPKSVEFVEAIPMTPVAKADKKALRAKYWGGAERAVH